MKKLGFGLMRLPQLDVDNKGSVDVEKVKKMADTFLSNGFTYFDTATPYHSGESEVAFREAVAKRYPREAYTITDKLSLFMIKKEEEIPGFFDKQLEKLGVDYIDYYLLHALNVSLYHQAEEMHAFEFVIQKKAEGKLKHIGLSFHDKANVLDEILTNHPEMEYVQLQLNYLDWEDESIESRKCYEVAIKHGKPVIVMEPIKGGSLINIPEEAQKLYENYRSDLSVASWAVRFAASHEKVIMVLSGMSNEEQMNDNISYMKDFEPLNNEEKKLVEQATKMIKESIIIPCTACQYCIPDCPKLIAIPDYFTIYNALKRSGPEQTMVAVTDYRNMIGTHGKASDCIKCGKCENRCPQHLPIRKYLEDVVEAVENVM